ncbi:UNVERIFIED_CONTAM: hypothetical protein K2H54_037261, partial [Gekko kuhli]
MKAISTKSTQDQDSYNSKSKIYDKKPMDGLKARSILVTGSNRGIGLELVRQLSEKKNRPEWIFATCRDPEGPRAQTAVNMLTRCQSLGYAEDEILCIALYPGWVQTDMGGMKAPMTVDTRVPAILNTFGRLSEKDNGAFLNWEGTAQPWGSEN